MPVNYTTHKANAWQRFTANWQSKFESARQQIRFLKYEKDFGERDTDIYIASFPRSGTTLLQVLVYHLTHAGGMDYKHIDDVSPWLRNLAVKQLPLPAIAAPRVIKTHDPYTLIHPGKKGKFIFMLRDAADVAVSNYHNWKNYNNPNLTFNEVFEKLIRTDAATGYFNFNHLWLENKNKLPVLYLRYEDVLANKRDAINKIADFLNVTISNTKINELITLSSFDYMKSNEHKFGEQPENKLEDVVYNRFIRNGRPGEGKAMLSEEQLSYCDKITPSVA